MSATDRHLRDATSPSSVLLATRLASGSGLHVPGRRRRKGRSRRDSRSRGQVRRDLASSLNSW